MANYIGGIDHAIVGVRDLEQARASFERLGFHTTPLARHPGRGTGEHCLMFADGYVELCGIIDPAGDSDSLGRFLAAGEGLWSVALRTTDPEGTHAAWRAATRDADGVWTAEAWVKEGILAAFRFGVLAEYASGALSFRGFVTQDREKLRSIAGEMPLYFRYPYGAMTPWKETTQTICGSVGPCTRETPSAPCVSRVRCAC